MRFLSLDPGIKRLGWAIFDGSLLEDHGVFGFRDKEDGESFVEYRDVVVCTFGTWFRQQVNDFAVSHVNTETVPVVSASRGFTATPQRLLVTVALSIFRWLSYELDLSWSEVSAITVKKKLIGDAKATKAQIRRAVLARYPEVQRNRKLGDIEFDETDAIAAGITGLEKYSWK
jgi:Holliday junction resolvasome RuvABC endonuclease subunit